MQIFEEIKKMAYLDELQKLAKDTSDDGIEDMATHSLYTADDYRRGSIGSYASGAKPTIYPQHKNVFQPVKDLEGSATISSAPAETPKLAQDYARDYRGSEYVAQPQYAESDFSGIEDMSARSMMDTTYQPMMFQKHNNGFKTVDALQNTTVLSNIAKERNLDEDIEQ